MYGFWHRRLDVFWSMKKKKTIGRAVAAAMGHSLKGAPAKEMNQGREMEVGSAASVSPPRQKHDQSPSAQSAASMPAGGQDVKFTPSGMWPQVGPGMRGRWMRSTSLAKSWNM